MGGVLGSEDCLTLTIYTPQKPAQAPLPVMVWIPGGGFVVGGASKEDWDPEFFLDKAGAQPLCSGRKIMPYKSPRTLSLLLHSTAWVPLASLRCLEIHHLQETLV